MLGTLSDSLLSGSLGQSRFLASSSSSPQTSALAGDSLGSNWDAFWVSGPETKHQHLGQVHHPSAGSSNSQIRWKQSLVTQEGKTVVTVKEKQQPPPPKCECLLPENNYNGS